MGLPQTLKAEAFLWLGAPSEGGFLAPSAQANPVSMYGPRGVFYDGKHIVVADTGNHRVLIWFSLPDRDHAPADIVLGQRDFFSDKPNCGGDPSKGMYMPCGVWIEKGALFVADSWNHRILFWEEVPQESFKAPDGVLGQENLYITEPTKGEGSPTNRFFWPYGLGFWEGMFFVCDTGNRRVLAWEGFPEDGREADYVLGEVMWPHSVSGGEGLLFIADAGNHRVLGLNKKFERKVVLGQKSFEESVDWSGFEQNSKTLRFPYGVSIGDGLLAVADTANNRVLIWRKVPREGTFIPADTVIGQEDFSKVGENALRGVYRDTLCWPYGVHLWKDTLLIADTGNNRITLWKLQGI